MTEKEANLFVHSLEKITDGWDMQNILPAYQHLSMDDAVDAYCKDLSAYFIQREKILAKLESHRIEAQIQ